MGYQDLIKQIIEDFIEVQGAALLHRNGFVVAYFGLDKEIWIHLTDVLKNVTKVAELLKSDIHGVDIVFEKYRVVIRRRENLIAIVITTIDIDSNISDYIAFKLIEEAMAL